MSRRTFDLILIMIILTKPAAGLVKMGARRWSRDSSGPMGVVGDAVQVAL
jgi:hypothetical protein